jgi:hypothetical protein
MQTTRVLTGLPVADDLSDRLQLSQQNLGNKAEKRCDAPAGSTPRDRFSKAE